MSPPPTRQLGQLSLTENMPTLRSQTRRRHRRTSPSNDEEPPESHPGDDSENPVPSSMVRAQSQLVYDIEHLELDSRARAMAGLQGRFDMIYCRADPAFFEFQLTERPRIRVRESGAECTCSEYEHRPDMACRHIFWLADQVYETVSPHTPLPLSKEGISPRLPPLHSLLHDRLETVAGEMQWHYISETNTSSDSSPETSTVGTRMSRQDKVRDIMSAFNEVILPADFRRDLVETTTQPRTPEQCVVQGDFEATVFRLAVHDDNVYASMRKAMPAGACAAIFFDKVQKQSRNLLMGFDEYRRTGRLPPGRRSLEVKEVAAELQRHVELIRTNLSLRVPYGTKGAAEALLALLQDVSARNIDAFEQSPWGRQPPPGEDEDDRNLYEQLIGQASSSSSGGETGGTFFVLDVLETLPASVLASYITNLNDILGKVEINRAPASFVRKLKSLIHEAQASLAASRAKRPATADAGASPKRTR